MTTTDRSVLTRLLEQAGLDITVLAALVGAVLVAVLLHTRRALHLLPASRTDL
jgi:hypothetical protein